GYIWTGYIWTAETASGKKTREYIKTKGGAGASLYDMVDFWQLENAVKLKELMELKLAPQPEAPDSETSDFFKADSEQEGETEDQHVKTEPQIVPDTVETSEP